jgi:hypothetical protein
MRRFSSLTLLPLLAACGPGLTTDPPPDCDDPVEGEASGDTFCGEPIVRAALGDAPDRFVLAEEGSQAEVHFGTQGGYHVYGAAEIENLGAVVFLTFRLLAAPTEADEHVELLNDQRHVQALRCERLATTAGTGVDATTCDERPTLGRWWGGELRFHCAYWPNDPANDPFCADASLGHIEQMHVLLEVTARDHNERTVTHTVAIDPVYEVPSE